VLLAACPALRALYYLQGYEYGAGYTWLTADGLACGALLAILVRGPLAVARQLGLFAAAAAVVALAIFLAGVPFGIYLSHTLAGATLRHTFLNLFFTALIAATLVGSVTRYSSLLRVGWLKFFGDISYGLYLIHMLAFDVVDHFGRRMFPQIYSASSGFPTMVARFIVGSGFSIALAYLSRWYFEERFLRLKETASKPAIGDVHEPAKSLAEAS
jgi:peptidoglycan/LPS O-acetylase OafA/YrhL